MCNKWWEALLALVVILFTLWTPATWTKWLVVIAGLIMLFHAFGCDNCNPSLTMSKTVAVKAKPKKRRKRR